MEDEQFAASLRPDSIFGVSGSDDYFDDDDDEYEYEEEASQRPPQYAPQYQQNAVSGSPVAVSGESLPATTSGGGFGAAISLFMLLGGAGIGYHYGGFKGAAGGALVGGALRNLYRAHNSITVGGDTLGGVKQGVIGTAVGGLGSYLLWTANRK